MSNPQLQISFEFFPPKTRAASIALSQTIAQLAPLKPNFVSVTYGAAGTTRERTYKTIKKIMTNTDLKAASHLTCIGANKTEIEKIAQKYWRIGIRHIVALRGDLPQGYTHPENSYNYASELVLALKKIANFEISVAGYPEKHPEAKTLQEDIDNLNRKIDAGADRVISQFFFDNNKFYEYLNLLEKKQIKIPIIPGILPIVNFKQMVKFAGICGASVPKHFYNLFDEQQTNETSRQLLAAHIAINQCQDLMKHGINNFHFYTLNRAPLTSTIFHILKHQACSSC